MPPVGFKSTISAGERPQTYALDRAATGTGLECLQQNYLSWIKCGSCRSDIIPSSYVSYNWNAQIISQMIYGT